MSLQIKKYVLGLAFWNNQIALIWKTKGPEYVKNSWNGIGGKVEDQDDDIQSAMTREFCEETGLFLSPDMWTHFATQKGTSWDGPGYELHILAATIPSDFDASKIENTEGDDEIVQWFSLNEISKIGITPNLKWMIPLSLDNTTGFLQIQEELE